MKKEIMKRAWEIARQGQEKFGGKVSEYLSEALKLAWKDARKVRIAVNYGWKKSYLAKIKGTHPKWKLDREFLKADDSHRSYSGKTGWDAYYVGDGLYEKQSGGRREYIVVRNGEVEIIEFDEVLSLIG